MKSKAKKQEFIITYKVWGNYTDCLLIGVGHVKARTMGEAIELAKKDFTEHREWRDFEMSRIELFDDGSEDTMDEEGNVIHCWNAYYEVKGKNGSYDGVGMPCTKTMDEAIMLQR